MIALQEVWGGADENHAQIVAEKLGFSYFHSEGSLMNGVGFGNAILSRWPIAEAKVVTLSGKPETGETQMRFIQNWTAPADR